MHREKYLKTAWGKRYINARLKNYLTGEKLKAFIATQEGKITNDLVEKEMKISDATATRYLNELESLGLIKQIGKEGQSVYYEKL